MHLRGPALLAALFTLATPALAHADWQVRVIARASAEDPFATAPVQARVGEPVELAIALVDRGHVFADAERVRVGRHRPRAPRGPLPDGLRVRWLQVVPRMEHQELEPPNPGIATFSNNVLFGPDHGDWLGYDQLEYDTIDLPGAGDDPTLTVDRAQPAWGRRGLSGAGSNWFAAEVTLPDGTVVRSADGDDVDRYGLSSDVERVSFREGDDFIGWLSTYFNVPHVFGSSGPSDARHQTERYLGADCADALVGAWRAEGHDEVAYSSVSGIGHDADPVTDDLFVGEDGVLRDANGVDVTLRWGDDVQRGDLVVIDFIQAGNWLPRNWDHIGALARDSGPDGTPDGWLDGADVVRHMGRHGLTDTLLWGFGQTRIRLWRWED